MRIHEIEILHSIPKSYCLGRKFPISELSFIYFGPNSILAMVLSRSELVHKNSFADEWPGVIQFLNSLKKPAVIISHNGARFDFRILHAELAYNNLLEKYPIPEGVSSRKI